MSKKLKNHNRKALKAKIEITKKLIATLENDDCMRSIFYVKKFPSYIGLCHVFDIIYEDMYILKRGELNLYFKGILEDLIDLGLASKVGDFSKMWQTYINIVGFCDKKHFKFEGIEPRLKALKTILPLYKDMLAKKTTFIHR